MNKPENEWPLRAEQHPQFDINGEAENIIELRDLDALDGDAFVALTIRRYEFAAQAIKENAELKDQLRKSLKDKMELLGQNIQLGSEYFALKAKIEGGVRVYAHDGPIMGWTAMAARDPHNATLILDHPETKL